MTAMYIVEVRRDALAQPMSEMRAWLDAHRIEVKVFKTTDDHWNELCRLPARISERE